MKRVHVHSQDFLKINDYKETGWRECKRFGDLVEMEYDPPISLRTKTWVNKMLTKLSGKQL